VHLYNPIGTLRGGYVATLLDSACGCAAHSKLSPTQICTTLELKAACHKPITRETGQLRTQGRVPGIVRGVAFTQATLKDAVGRL
jgi:uncharacterized protein (TIGR00369 family)